MARLALVRFGLCDVVVRDVWCRELCGACVDGRPKALPGGSPGERGTGGGAIELVWCDGWADGVAGCLCVGFDGANGGEHRVTLVALHVV